MKNAIIAIIVYFALYYVIGTLFTLLAPFIVFYLIINPVHMETSELFDVLWRSLKEIAEKQGVGINILIYSIINKIVTILVTSTFLYFLIRKSGKSLFLLVFLVLYVFLIDLFWPLIKIGNYSFEGIAISLIQLAFNGVCVWIVWKYLKSKR